MRHFHIENSILHRLTGRLEKNFKIWTNSKKRIISRDVDRARKIMQRNQDNGYTLYQYKGYQYYKENPSLTAWEAIEKILKDCELIV